MTMLILGLLCLLLTDKSQSFNQTEDSANVLSNPCTDKNNMILVPGVLTAGGTNRACVSRFFPYGVARVQLALYTEDRLASTAMRDLPPGDGGCLDITVPPLPNMKADLFVSIVYTEVQCVWERRLAVRIASGRVIVLQTERARYRPGDTVRLRIIALKPDLAPTHGMIEEVWLEGPRGLWEGTRETQWLRLRTLLGLAQIQYELDSLAPPGKWTFRAKLEDGSQGSAVFWVGQYELPPFQLTVRHPPRILRTIERLAWTVCVRYPWSEAVEGMLVIRIRGAGRGGMGVRTAVQLKSPKACHRHAVAAKRVGLHSPNPPDVLVADFSFQEDGTRIWQNTTVVSQVVEEELSLEFLTKHRTVISPGLPYKLKVKATRWDDKPAPNTIIMVCRYATFSLIETTYDTTTDSKNCVKGQTDVNGVARVMFPAVQNEAPFYKFEAYLRHDNTTLSTLRVRVRQGTVQAELGPLKPDSWSTRTLVPLYINTPITTAITVHFVVITRGGIIYRWGATTQSPTENLEDAPKITSCDGKCFEQSIMPDTDSLENSEATANKNCIKREIKVDYSSTDNELAAILGDLTEDETLERFDQSLNEDNWHDIDDPNRNITQFTGGKPVTKLLPLKMFIPSKNVTKIKKPKIDNYIKVPKRQNTTPKTRDNISSNGKPPEIIRQNTINNTPKSPFIISKPEKMLEIKPEMMQPLKVPEKSNKITLNNTSVEDTSDTENTDNTPIVISDALLARKLRIMLPIKVSHQMCPDSHIIAYFFYKGELVSASKRFEMDECFANEAEATWLSRQALPGSPVSLQVRTTGPALCALSVLDTAAKWNQPPPSTKELLLNSLKRLMDSHRNLTEYDAAGECFLTDDSQEIPTSSIELTSMWLASAGVRLLGGDVIKNSKRHCKSQPPAALVSEERAPRSDFSEAWLWRLLPISLNGTGIATARAPDSITKFEASATCLSKTGIAVSPPAVLQVFREFFIHADAPTRLRRGDTGIFRYRIFNYLYQPLSVQIRTDNDMVQPYSPSPTVCVGARSAVARRARISPLSAQPMRLSLRAQSVFDPSCINETTNGTVIDEVVIHIAIDPEGVPVHEQKSIMLCGNESDFATSQVEWVWPAVATVPGTESLTLWTVGDVTGPLLADADSLIVIPRGCGEQNMAQLATNLLALQQLDKISIAALTAKEHVARGFTRQMQYIHPTGGFSAFGPSDATSSTWLTAFAVRHLRKAHQLLFPNIQTPMPVIHAEQWLINQQMENGCFRNEGQVFHRELRGGLNEEGEIASVALTAYVITSLIESTAPVPYRVLRNSFSCLRALPPLKSKSATRTYAQALLAYAYMRIQKNEEDLQKTNKANLLRHMGLEKDEGVRQVFELLKIAKRSEGYVWWEASSLATSIETTSYALLALHSSPEVVQLRGGTGVAAAALRWLASHRSSTGGFVSTQDTLVALEALTRWSGRANPSHLYVTAQSDSSSHTITLLPGSRIPDILKLAPGEKLKVDVSGSGCALVQATRSYHTMSPLPIDEKDKSLSVQVAVHTDGPFNCEYSTITNCFCAAVIETCVLWSKDFPEMALLDVTLPGGYGVDAQLLYSQLNQQGSLLRRIEVSPSNNHASLYLGSRDASSLVPRGSHECFRVHAVGPRARTRPAYVRLLDYYAPEHNDTQMFTIPEDCTPRITHKTSEYRTSDNLYDKARSAKDGEILMSSEFTYENIPSGVPLEMPIFENLTEKEKIQDKTVISGDKIVENGKSVLDNSVILKKITDVEKDNVNFYSKEVKGRHYETGVTDNSVEQIFSVNPDTISIKFTEKHYARNLMVTEKLDVQESSFVTERFNRSTDFNIFIPTKSKNPIGTASPWYLHKRNRFDKFLSGQDLDIAANENPMFLKGMVKKVENNTKALITETPHTIKKPEKLFENSKNTEITQFYPNTDLHTDNTNDEIMKHTQSIRVSTQQLKPLINQGTTHSQINIVPTVALNRQLDSETDKTVNDFDVIQIINAYDTTPAYHYAKHSRDGSNVDSNNQSIESSEQNSQNNDSTNLTAEQINEIVLNHEETTRDNPIISSQSNIRPVSEAVYNNGVNNPNLNDFHIVDSDLDLDVPTGVEGPIPTAVLPPPDFVPASAPVTIDRRVKTQYIPHGPYRYFRPNKRYNKLLFVPQQLPYEFKDKNT